MTGLMLLSGLILLAACTNLHRVFAARAADFCAKPTAHRSGYDLRRVSHRFDRFSSRTAALTA